MQDEIWFRGYSKLRPRTLLPKHCGESNCLVFLKNEAKLMESRYVYTYIYIYTVFFLPYSFISYFLRYSVGQ